jgi:hypothetical protein
MQLLKPVSNERGVTMMVVVLIFMVASLGLASMSSVGTYQLRNERRSFERLQALYLAEAAVAEAKAELKGANFASALFTGDGDTLAMADGEFYYNISAVEEELEDPDCEEENCTVIQRRTVEGYGVVPDFENSDTARAVRVVVEKEITAIPDVFDKTIYAVDDINKTGNSGSIDGDVFAGDDNLGKTAPFEGAIETMNDEAWANFDMPLEELKQIAEEQGNYYADAPDVSTLPNSFWFEEPAEGSPGVPNVIFIEGDVSYSGNDDFGGFLVVAGDYLNNPDAPDPAGDVTLGGNIDLDGVIFSVGNATVHGGGNPADWDVNGAIYAWGDVLLNGSIHIDYNAEYAAAIGNLASGVSYSTVSWNEVHYEVEPEI